MGGLLVSNTWVYGDVMDLKISRQRSEVGGQETVLVRLYCEPGKPHVLLGSPDFANWIPLVTNTPAGSFFDFTDPDWPGVPRRFYRAVKAEQVITNLSLFFNRTNGQARLSVTARPGQETVLQASPDLRHWTSLATNPAAAPNLYQFLDTNAPAFPQRFYRAWGVGK